MVELQDLLEKQNYELAQMKERMSSLSSRVSEVEQELETARKDLIKSEEMNNKYQRDIKEVTDTHTRALTHTDTHTQSEEIGVARQTSKKSWQRPYKKHPLAYAHAASFRVTVCAPPHHTHTHTFQGLPPL